MCGYLVQFLSNSGIFDDSKLRSRLDRLAHRGPDQRNIWKNHKIWMGHQRLVLLGGEESGKQPLINEVGDALAYNGEIYNFKELQSKYLTTNYLCDSEVLFALLTKIGAPILRELRGMFSFVYYEGRTSKILLARDPFGIKPLFYRKLADRWEFCSELRGFEDLTLDPIQVEIFHYHLATLPGKTLYSDVYELRPGSCLQIHEAEYEIEHYLTLGSVFNQASHLSLGNSRSDDYSEEFASLFEDSVSIHMTADNFPGLILSGGLDSGCMALALRNELPSVYTLSVPDLDEKDSAIALSRAFNFEHKIFELDTVFDFQSILSAMDAPIGDASFFPTWDLFNQLKMYQKSVLGGDGGDEIFYGYPSFEVEALRRRCPRIMNEILQKIGLYFGCYSSIKVDFREKLLRFGWGKSELPMMRQMQFMAAGPMEGLSLNAMQAIRENFNETLSLEEINPHCHWSQIFTYYFRYYLATQVLVKSDRASMSHSVELRCPYLDWSFFSKIFRFPSRDFPILSSRKQILRSYYLKHKKNGNFKKFGFSAPLHKILPNLESFVASVRGRKIRSKEYLFDRSNSGIHSKYAELVFEYFHGNFYEDYCLSRD